MPAATEIMAIYCFQPMEEAYWVLSKASNDDIIKLLYTSPEEQSQAHSQSLVMTREAAELGKRLDIKVERKLVDK